jgi:hypothetical protein
MGGTFSPTVRALTEEAYFENCRFGISRQTIGLAATILGNFLGDMSDELSAIQQLQIIPD